MLENKNIVYSTDGLTFFDGLTIEKRKKRKDKKRCRCGVEYKDGKKGWYVPSFKSYIDIFNYCPFCIKNSKIQYNYIIKRYPKASEELDGLQEKLRKLPCDDSHVYYDENKGLVYHDIDEQGVTQNSLTVAFEDFINRKKEIENLRKQRAEMEKKIHDLHKEIKVELFSGSPSPNMVKKANS
jgi:hypothetical protein